MTQPLQRSLDEIFGEGGIASGDTDAARLAARVAALSQALSGEAAGADALLETAELAAFLDAGLSDASKAGAERARLARSALARADLDAACALLEQVQAAPAAVSLSVLSKAEALLGTSPPVRPAKQASFWERETFGAARMPAAAGRRRRGWAMWLLLAGLLLAVAAVVTLVFLT